MCACSSASKRSRAYSRSMYALRLRPGEELLSTLKAFCVDRGRASAYVATCVGSLQKATLRLANADRHSPNEIRSYEQRFEITSLVGTISRDGGAHVHIGLADAAGALSRRTRTDRVTYGRSQGARGVGSGAREARAVRSKIFARARRSGRDDGRESTGVVRRDR